MSSSLPSGTVTFLFTDIEGSTRLLHALGGASYHEALTRHQEILRDAARAAGGREIDTQGDSFFFAFSRATHAALAAVNAQRELAAQTWPDNATLRVRMGIDTGEPTVGADRYVGIGIHRTARIMAAGHGGQILVSDTTRGLIEDDLPPDVHVRDLGLRRLKDLGRPVRVYQLAATGLQDEFPPLRTLDTRPRRRLLGALGIAAVVVVAAAAVALTRVGGGGVAVHPNSVAALDAGGTIVADVAVGDTPTALVAASGALWALNANEQTISRIDLPTRKELAKLPAGGAPTSLAASAGALWVANDAHTLTELDPGSGSVLRSVKLPSSPNPLLVAPESWVASDGRDVWATGKGTAQRVAPTRLEGRVGDVACCSGIAVGGGSVWLTGGRSVLRLNSSTGARETTIELPFTTTAATFGAGLLWVVDARGNKVWAIDPKNNAPAGSVSVGQHPQAVAVGSSGVWIASADGSVTNVDPVTLGIRRTIKVAGSPSGIVIARDLVWVSID